VVAVLKLATADWSKGLAAGRVLSCVEIDVPDASIAGPMPSLACSLGAAGWSRGLAADRVLVGVEVDVSHVVFTMPARSLC
jgi:hypothetical protein